MSVKKKLSLPFLQGPSLYSVPQRVLNNTAALTLIISEFLLGIAGYMYFEDYSFREAFYMTVITISTVGYTEVRPLSPEGQWFSSFLILLNIGIFAYVLSVFSYYIFSGEIFKKMHQNMIGSKIDALHNHVIVCGYGRYGQEVVQNFLHQNMAFVVIENDAAVIDIIQKNKDKILYIQDDATRDEALQEAGIMRAKALITALPDDSNNLFIVMTARQMNSKLDIISRTSDSRSKRKLELAGANHVIMPEQIGGFYMATLVSKPGATEFFSYLTRDVESDIDFEEVRFMDMPSNYRNKTIRELDMRRETGANIIGFKQPDGGYIVNPGPETKLVENSSLIVLGTQEHLKNLRIYLSKQ